MIYIDTHRYRSTCTQCPDCTSMLRFANGFANSKLARINDIAGSDNRVHYIKAMKLREKRRACPGSHMHTLHLNF